VKSAILRVPGNFDVLSKSDVITNYTNQPELSDLMTANNISKYIMQDIGHGEGPLESAERLAVGQKKPDSMAMCLSYVVQ